MKTSYAERAQLSTSLATKKIFHLMQDKQTNLALSADVTSSAALIDLADQLGPEICMLKTHIDIIEDFSLDLINQLKTLANKHQFLLCEDRKFADIGNTVKAQYASGQYRIADWADLVTVYAIPGPGILQSIASVRKSEEQGVLLLAQLSSIGHLLDETYFSKTISMADAFPNLVAGFITQQGISPHGGFISMTPGVQLESKGDNLGQGYITPRKAVFDHFTDVIIVGRGIIAAEHPLKAAKVYRQAGWDAYQDRN